MLASSLERRGLLEYKYMRLREDKLYLRIHETVRVKANNREARHIADSGPLEEWESWKARAT